MAKVEIEDRAFNDPKITMASALNRVPIQVIIGYAATLWRNSQQVGAVSGTKQEILVWLDIGRFGKPKKAFKWLLDAELIRVDILNENNYFIDGNSWRIPRTQKRIENAKKAARARYDKESSCDSHAQRSADSSADSSATRMPNSITRLQDNNLNTNSTHNPSASGGVNSRKQKRETSPRRQQAHEMKIAELEATVAVEAIRVCSRESDSQNDLKARMEPLAFAAFIESYGSWERFLEVRYKRIVGEKTPHAVFEAQLKSALAAAIYIKKSKTVAPNSKAGALNGQNPVTPNDSG